jgi:hypothetical protein
MFYRTSSQDPPSLKKLLFCINIRAVGSSENPEEGTSSDEVGIIYPLLVLIGLNDSPKSMEAMDHLPPPPPVPTALNLIRETNPSTLPKYIYECSFIMGTFYGTIIFSRTKLALCVCKNLYQIYE